MNEVSILSASDRFDLFTTAAAQRGDITAAVVEKDFWVCWTLKQLFTMDNYRDHLLFKGGTSLSKVFGLIQRFSEDIDLAVDWELLGYVGDKTPMADLSNTKRAAYSAVNPEWRCTSIALSLPMICSDVKRLRAMS